MKAVAAIFKDEKCFIEVRRNGKSEWTTLEGIIQGFRHRKPRQARRLPFFF